MALYQVTNGNTAVQLDLDQYFNLLTGAMSDQPVTINNTLTANTLTSTGLVQGTGLKATGVGQGSASSGRYIANWTTIGPPTTLTAVVGDHGFDTNGTLWFCTAAGTPGTWRAAGPGLISKQTLGASVASVTFSSIPGGFTNLVLYYQARSDTAAFEVDVAMQFNGDAGANYSQITIDQTATSAGADNPTGSLGLGATSIGWIGMITAASYSAGQFGSGRIEVPFYSSTSGAKQAFGQAVAGTGGRTLHKLRAGAWTTGTGAAITQITLTTTGNFIANSIFSLYGYP